MSSTKDDMEEEGFGRASILMQGFALTKTEGTKSKEAFQGSKAQRNDQRIVR